MACYIYRLIQFKNYWWTTEYEFYKKQIWCPLLYFHTKVGIPLVCDTKIDNTITVAKFCVESHSIPDRLDKTYNGGGLYLYRREDILSKQIKLKSFEV